MDRIALYRGLRHAGRSAREIADKWELGSPEALFRLFSNDGFPICEICGEYSREPDHCEQAEAKRKRKPRRGGGQKLELPDAAEAEPLFREALEDLLRSLEMLKHRTEYLKDERFVASEAVAYTSAHSRSDWPEEEEWRNLCEKLGQNPEQEQVAFEAIRRSYVGAAQSPPGTLTKLIAVYVLAGKPIEPLIEKLHHDPGSVDWQRLTHIEGKKRDKGRTPGLLGEARTVARLARGGTVREGPSTGELTTEELGLARLISMFAKDGASDEEIRQKLKDEQLTREDIARLRNLRLDS